ncbi:hypothetical protein BgiMline_010684, partial [Biomphalaria glabrata]
MAEEFPSKNNIWIKLLLTLSTSIDIVHANRITTNDLQYINENEIFPILSHIIWYHVIKVADKVK